MVILVYCAIVACSVTQSATTKLFNKHSANSAVFNAVKALSSFLLFALMAIGGFTFHLPTLLFGLSYGTALCLSMYTGYRALCQGPMALTSMLVSFSVIVPLLWGVTVGNEQLTPIRMIALILLLGAIVLTNTDKLRGKRAPREADAPSKKSSYLTWMLFVGATFLCNGICSVLQKQHQTLYPATYNREFMFFAMLLCALVFLAVLLAKCSPAAIKATKGTWLGALSGVANGLAGFFTLLLAGLENASVLFPIISAGTLLGVVLCGRFLLKEKLRLNHYLALLLGMLAVVFLKL